MAVKQVGNDAGRKRIGPPVLPQPPDWNRSVVHNVNMQVMSDFLHENIIYKALDAHITKFFDTSSATSRLSENVGKSSSFIVPISTFVRGETNSAIADQYCNSQGVRKELMEDIEAYGHMIQAPTSRVDSDTKRISR